MFTEWMGQSPDLVEDQITYPISAALIAAPKVQAVRGQSMFGMSFVNVIFDEGTDIYWARSRVLEYMSSVRAKLPAGVNPTLGPDATGVGWVFEYALVDKSGKHDLQELRSLQDWNVRYSLESVSGVAEVASVGGFVKQYQVNVDPNKLLGHGVTMDDVVKAVRASNETVGGRVIEIAGHEHVIRGRGYVKKPEDIASSPIKVENGTPIRVRDVANVNIGPDIRRGLTELNGEGEAPGGIVIMRYGENALHVIDRVKERLEEIKKGLPEGVQVVTTYDRSTLIEDSVHIAPAHAHRGDARGEPHHLRLPAPRAERPHPHPHVAARCAARVHSDVPAAPDGEHHVARRHRRGHRCDGGRVDHHHRKHPQEAR